MHDEVRFSGAFFQRHFPPIGRCRNQHKTSRGANFPHQIEVAANGVGAIRILVAIFRISDRLINFHLRPIGIQFICHHERQSRAAAASHLRTMSDDRDDAVGRNRHPQTWFKFSFGGFSFGGECGYRNKARTQYKNTASQSSL